MFLNYQIYSFIAPCNGLQGAVAQYAANQTRNTRANPYSLRYKSSLRSFMCITRHTGTYALHPIQSTPQ